MGAVWIKAIKAATKPEAALNRAKTNQQLELVKNACDTDVSCCEIFLKSIASPRDATILVEDDGTGMDWTTVTDD